MSDTHMADDPVSPQIETEARDYGWAPKEQFKGPADKWKPADEYLGWAKQSGRLPRAEFDDIKRQFPLIRGENKALKDELAEIKTTLTQFVEFSSKAEERSFARARSELEQKIEQAAANADPVAARAAMQELAALKPEVKEKPAPVERKPEVDPVVQDWIGKEDWFTKNATLNSYAVETFGELERSKPGVGKAELLAETKRKTMEKFPEKFGINPARDAAPTVVQPTNTGRAPKRGKTYDDLPADAKQACDKFVRSIPGYTREKYVKDYEWDN